MEATEAFHPTIVSPGSRTSTPTTVVRSRPRPPPMLSVDRSWSFEHPPTADGCATAAVLAELGRTDFVRKYSRRVRPPIRPELASPTSELFDVRSTASSPLVSASRRLRSPDGAADAGESRSRSSADDFVVVDDSNSRRGGAEPAEGDETETDSVPLPETAPAVCGWTKDGQMFSRGTKTSSLDHRNRGAPHDHRNTPVCDDSSVSTRMNSCDVNASSTGCAASTSSQSRMAAGRTDSDSRCTGVTGNSDHPTVAHRGLFRSESDSAKVRSFTLRPLRPRPEVLPSTAAVNGDRIKLLEVGQHQSGTSRLWHNESIISGGSTDRSGIETDDEGVGALDIDCPSFKDTYTSVTTCKSVEAGGSGGTRPTSLNLQQVPSRPADEAAATFRRCQRYVDSTPKIPPCPPPKPASISRFLTHPPVNSATQRESGSMDSNGLGSLRDNADTTRCSLPSQVSVSSADSHICPSEDSSDFTTVVASPTPPVATFYGCSAQPEMTSSSTVAGMDSPDLQLSRRNSKTQKQKSRSDPSGEKNGENTVDIPSIVSGSFHAQSSPVLLDDKRDRDDPSDTQFPFILDSASSDMSDRGGASTAGPSSDKRSVSSMHDVAVRVVLKSDDSFDDVPPTAVKPPRPRKSRPRAPAAPAAAASPASSPGSAESTSVAPASLVKKVLSGVRQKEPSITIAAADSSSSTPSTTSSSSSTSSLTLPLSKKSSLWRSHSSAGTEAASVTSDSSTGRPKEALSATPSGRRRCPGAQDATQGGDGGQVGVVTTSASVPELRVAAGSASPRLPSKNSSSMTAATPTVVAFPSLHQPVISRSTLSLFEGGPGEKPEKQEKRDLIMQEFYDTERQYVETLQMLVEKYMIPLKTQNVIDSSLVDDIFYKINEIYMHHATFITFLAKALRDWDANTTIGDIIDKNFSKQTVIDSYISFIEHFPRAEKVLDEVSTKSSFQKFVEQCERDTRTKLPLKAQIVKPAQRIPRYELLLKRLVDNTQATHPDFAFLHQAEKTIHELALRINSVKESKHEEDLLETLKKLELLLLTDLAASDRLYLRHDMVTIPSRKDQQYCVWLFSDLLVFSCIKRKPGSVNRRTSLLLQSPSGHDFVENTKHKLWLKVSLDAVELTHVDDLVLAQQVAEKQDLENDVVVLGQIIELSAQLKSPHEMMEETLQDVLGQVNSKLSEYQLKTMSPEAHSVELVTSTPEGILNIVMQFPSLDKKSSWEASFVIAKQKFVQVTDSRPPEFLQSLQITKTRAGMQFSCAALSEPETTGPRAANREVWVCNSDNYIGHMCLLSLQAEPIVTLNTPVPGCSSRILCICSVPGLQHRASVPLIQPPVPVARQRRKASKRRRVAAVEMPQIRIDELKEESEDGYASDSTSDSCSGIEDEDTEDVPSPPANVDDAVADHGRDSRSPSLDTVLQSAASSQQPQVADGPTSVPSSAKDSPTIDAGKSTMWLGAEDGWLHIFASAENIKTTKSSMKILQSAGVLGIVYFNQRVIVSLSNGDLVVYKRNDHNGAWDCTEPELVLNVSNSSAPVNRMLTVNGKLWCACLNDVIVLNFPSLDVDMRFTTTAAESKRGIQCMAWSGHGVWIAGHSSSRILLYHISTYEQLLEVNVAPAVAQKLQTADDIIRQHKMACLRVTALLACRDTLWIGTSAGVILTLPMPKLTVTSTKAGLSSPTVTGLFYGHTGHVRFLTSVELSRPLTPQSNQSSPQPSLDVPVSTSSSTPRRHATFSAKVSSVSGSSPSIGGVRQRPATPPGPIAATQTPPAASTGISGWTLVISGGDGFEDFRSVSAGDSETAGRDDSTNHLLLWKVS